MYLSLSSISSKCIVLSGSAPSSVYKLFRFQKWPKPKLNLGKAINSKKKTCVSIGKEVLFDWSHHKRLCSSSAQWPLAPNFYSWATGNS